jgi:hypothetical protein
MSAVRRLRVPKYGLALVASAACLALCLALASCSATSAPPLAGTTATSTVTVTAPGQPSKVAPPTAETSPLAKNWKSYGGTAYFGCPEEFTLSKSALEEIRPKIFDIKTGQFTTAGIPALPAGENITGGVCALSNTIDDMRIVYVLTTLIPAHEAEPDVAKTTAYMFDLKSNQPLATTELQPPTPDLKLTAMNGWRLAATASGVAWMNAFTDGHAAASPPRTVLLSNTDLSMLWNDPQPARVWQDVLAFQRNTTVGKMSGAELRLPNGEPVYQDNDIVSVDAELSDGPDKLVKMTRQDPSDPRLVSTTFFDLNTRSVVKFGDTDRISGGGLTATLSDGRLFVDGRGSDTSQFGFGVWNLRSQQWDMLKKRDEAAGLSISRLASFGDRLYVTHAAGTLSVIALPAGNQVASTWSTRPFGRISGWTLVCRGETPAGGDCREIVLVQDQDGRYPGPWL